jgi:hypothetical protein
MTVGDARTRRLDVPRSEGSVLPTCSERYFCRGYSLRAGRRDASAVFEVACVIADIVDILATARSGRIVRATLSARRIGATFAEVRGELSARTLHAEVRKRDRATRVLWSLWIGRFQKPVPWLVEERFKETRYAFLLLLERDGFVGVLGSNIGNIADFVSDDRVSYQKLLALHSDADTEIESLSTRSLRAAPHASASCRARRGVDI